MRTGATVEPPLATARPSTRAVMAGLWHGLSLPRALLYAAIRGCQLRGKVLDLGSSQSSASYLKLFRKTTGVEVTLTNIKAQPGVTEVNVEDPFPFADGTFDVVCAFNLFEHVLHFDRCPDEVARVLKNGGLFYYGTPFLLQIHPNPNDYFRYTASAIAAIWGKSGLVVERISPLGGPCMAILHIFSRALVPPRVRGKLTACLLPLAILLDRAVDAISLRRSGERTSHKYPLFYFAIFRNESGLRKQT